MLIFVSFSIVQYNDPDPWLWIPTYLFPIFLIYQKSIYRIEGKSLFLIGVPYLFWAINQFPAEWDGVLLDQMGMKTLNIELGRESLGLGFTTVVLWILSFIRN
jgi:hypothetical protein